MKVNNAINIPTSLDSKFFRYWLEFLKPFHKLTEREMQVATCLIKNRYELSKVIQDVAILDKVSLGDDAKKRVMEECNLQLPHLQVFLTKLKLKNVIENDRINPKFIPNIREDEGHFLLLLHFDLSQ